MLITLTVGYVVLMAVFIWLWVLTRHLDSFVLQRAGSFITPSLIVWALSYLAGRVRFWAAVVCMALALILALIALFSLYGNRERTH